MNKRIFIAAPYSNAPDDNIAIVSQYVAKLVSKGIEVHAPMIVAHQIYEHVPSFTNKEWEIWTERFMHHCTELHVVTLPGWLNSSGVQNEINLAQNILSIPVKFIQVDQAPRFTIKEMQFNVPAQD